VTPDGAIHLANHLWQSTLFVAVVWLINLALRQNRAAVRHALWVTASLKFLIPFSFLVAVGRQFHWPLAAVPASPSVSVLIGGLGQPFGAASLVSPLSSSPGSSIWMVLFTVWMFGFSASLVWWGTRWLQLRRAVRQSTPLSLNVPMRVVVHQGKWEPGVFGIFKPVLLLPAGITDRLSTAQLQSLLAHERCHVLRRDNLTAAMHMVVEALFWFYPLVWWIRLRLIDEQERACDEAVLRNGGDPQVYAESILKVCECYLTSPSMCVSGITSSNLKKRIGDIMKNRVALELSLTRTLLLALGAAAALAGPIMLGSAGKGTVSVAPETGPIEVTPAPPVGLRGEGPASMVQEYRLEEVKIVGATVFNHDLIRSQLQMVSGEIYDESQLRRGLEKLKRLYGNIGYVNLVPEPAPEVDEQRKVVNLTLNIDEGRQFTVSRIRFTGNTTTPEAVLRREVLLKEGSIFDGSLLELSLLRLNQLGVFEEIKVEDVMVNPSPDEAKLDINLRVKEKDVRE
jgi:beta-lactamase regulating signal transducer with metallopeptidase domain